MSTDRRERSGTGSVRAQGDASGETLWPSPQYTEQVERLRAAVGETIYLAEVAETDVQLGVRVQDKPFVLLGVVDFPRPDPSCGLAPHLILLDDGRGVNLGRILRISRDRPFGPEPGQVLFEDRRGVQALLTRERRLSPELIAQTSRALLGRILGEPAAPPSLDAPDAASGDGPSDPGSTTGGR
jgi:hypothetical protein